MKAKFAEARQKDAQAIKDTSENSDNGDNLDSTN